MEEEYSITNPFLNEEAIRQAQQKIVESRNQASQQQQQKPVAPTVSAQGNTPQTTGFTPPATVQQQVVASHDAANGEAATQTTTTPGTINGKVFDPNKPAYEQIYNAFGKPETPQEKYQREMAEYRKQNIGNMLSLGTAIGNMLITSGNRYGRAVQSPNFSESIKNGIATRELERRQNEAARVNAIQKQQDLEQKQQKQQSDRDLAMWKIYNDNANRAADREQKAEQFEKAEQGRNARNKANIDSKADEKEKDRKSKIRSAMIRGSRSSSSTKTSGGNGKETYDYMPYSGVESGQIPIPNKVWSKSPENIKKVIKAAVAEERARQEQLQNEENERVTTANKDKGFFEDKEKAKEVENFFDKYDDIDKMTPEQMRIAISEYITEYPDSEVVGEIIKLSGDKDLQAWWDAQLLEEPTESNTTGFSGKPKK